MLEDAEPLLRCQPALTSGLTVQGHCVCEPC